MKSKTIILSIHPCHIEKIFSGDKLYEYRKVAPLEIQNIVIYATSPIKKIVAIIEVDKILTNTPNTIWEQTNRYAGVSKDFFMEYFRNKEKAFAIHFKTIHKLNMPKPLSAIGIKQAPQSYIYIDDSFNLCKNSVITKIG